MLQLVNPTPFRASIAVLPNRQAIDSLYVVVKATLELAPQLRCSERQMPAVLTDEYRGDAGASSIKYASELHIGKAGTDVLLVGSAHAPPGSRVTDSAVVVSVAERKKIVWVLGDRVWGAGGPSSPEPFETMPLTFERAYGGRGPEGVDASTPMEERNPVGVGFRGGRSASEMYGTALPSLEDPRFAIATTADQPPPACFGFVGPGWLPRKPYCGTYDSRWERTRAPYLPDDFDHRFFNMAAPELTFQRFLSGGEPIEVLGASPQGPLRFEVPRATVDVRIKIAQRLEAPPARLETVLIEPDENRVILTWRAEIECDRCVPKVETVTIDGRGWTELG